ncbi:MAG TPA: hypothetical protein VGR04_02500 [Acidimicrobiia bacterium]|nr:hypothetical protein [Acidimicrobiia bacterium]
MSHGTTPGASVEDVAESTEANAGTAVGAADHRPPPSPATRFTSRLFLLSVVVALVPVAVATTRAIRNGWIPTEDNALWAIRSRDLFSLTHLPLIGSWSSVSLSVKTLVNHPGPLYFDVLAVPARLFEPGAGVAFGVALVNTLCIVGIAVFAHRRGGALLGTIAMATTAALCWAMGSELLFDPWGPHAVLLPFLFFLVLVWSMTCGDLLALPFAVGVGSLVVQTHLSYVLLVPLLGAWGILGLAVALGRERGQTPDAWSDRRRRALRYSAVGGVVLAVCWIQPLIEQFTSDGRGNITRLLDSARSPTDTIGFGFGTRVLATVVSLPPWWFRPSMNDAFVTGWHAPSLVSAVFSLAILAVVFAGCGWDSRRRQDRVSTWALATAAVAVAIGLLTAGRGPVTAFGKVTSHSFRWLWPLGAFVFLAVAVSLGRRLARRAMASAAVALVGVFTLATVAVAALNLPFSDEGGGPNSFGYAIPAARDLASHMGSLEGQGPLLIDDLFHGAFADPYGGAAAAELQLRGIPFVTGDAALERHLGPARRFNGRNAKAALLLRTGDATLETPPGSRRVAQGEGLSAADQRELLRLKTQIAGYLVQGRLRLDGRGQAALERGSLPNLAQVQGSGADPRVLFTSRELDVMVRDHLLVLDDVWSKRFERYADLQHQWDQQTVALFVAPIPAGRS